MDDQKRIILQREIEAGEKATRVIEAGGHYLTDLYETERRQLIDAWANSPVQDKEGREHLYLTLLGMDRLYGLLHQVTQDGKRARAELEAEEGVNKILG